MVHVVVACAFLSCGCVLYFFDYECTLDVVSDMQHEWNSHFGVVLKDGEIWGLFCFGYDTNFVLQTKDYEICRPNNALKVPPSPGVLEHEEKNILFHYGKL